MGTMETSNDSSHFKKHSETLGGFAFLLYLCDVNRLPINVKQLTIFNNH